ncbi:MAG: DUF2085 domain-containing protein [Bacteroidetes bacterium]|nr:DUF2085 domain-containing protein [Bacteroidota bacterium]MBU2585199.1 DUF2085 domain-containing protein [Bacteroidota bacterium]
MNEQKIFFYLNLFLITLIGIWLGFSFATFLFPDNFEVQFVTKYIYGETCHQIPERSFCFDHKSMFICSRCFGIYAGLFAGLILFTSKKLSLRIDRYKFKKLFIILVLFAVPFISDIILSKLLIYDSGNTFRFTSGFLLFIPFSYFISSSINNLSKEIFSKVIHAK